MSYLLNGVEQEKSPETDREWFPGYICKLENQHEKEY